MINEIKLNFSHTTIGRRNTHELGIIKGSGGGAEYLAILEFLCSNGKSWRCRISSNHLTERGHLIEIYCNNPDKARFVSFVDIGNHYYKICYNAQDDPDVIDLIRIVSEHGNIGSCAYFIETPSYTDSTEVVKIESIYDPSIFS